MLYPEQRTKGQPVPDTIRHKIVWTFIETLLGFATVDALIPVFGGTINVSFWQQALAASVAAAIVPLKEHARARRGGD